MKNSSKGNKTHAGCVPWTCQCKNFHCPAKCGNFSFREVINKQGCPECECVCPKCHLKCNHISEPIIGETDKTGYPKCNGCRNLVDAGMLAFTYQTHLCTAPFLC